MMDVNEVSPLICHMSCHDITAFFSLSCQLGASEFRWIKRKESEMYFSLALVLTSCFGMVYIYIFFFFFSILLPFSLSMSSYFKFDFHRKHPIGFCFYIHFNILCLLIGVFCPLTFSVIIDVLEFRFTI